MSTYLFKPSHQTTPWSNVNGHFVNKWNSNSPAQFGSTETSRQFGKSGISNNAEAAAASTMKGFKGWFGMKGGSRKRSRKNNKNNNISYKYKKMGNRNKTGGNCGCGIKMGGSRRRKTRRGKVSRRGRASRKMMQRGGAYHQYGSQIPNTPSYSVGGMLAAKNSALANPAPIEKHSALGNCTDNYNHNTNKGFQWW